MFFFFIYIHLNKFTSSLFEKLYFEIYSLFWKSEEQYSLTNWDCFWWFFSQKTFGYKKKKRKKKLRIQAKCLKKLFVFPHLVLVTRSCSSSKLIFPEHKIFIDLSLTMCQVLYPLSGQSNAQDAFIHLLAYGVWPLIICLDISQSFSWSTNTCLCIFISNSQKKHNNPLIDSGHSI